MLKAFLKGNPIMKKLIIITLVLALALSFAACGKEDMTGESDMLGETPVTDMADDMAMGLGVTVKHEGYSASAEASGQTALESYIAAVTFDKDGKVHKARLDCVESTGTFDAAGAFSSDESSAYSKRELGDDYGMRQASGIGKEWYEQVDALETWMEGKTIEEIQQIDENETEIRSSCTISTDGFIEAVKKAHESMK